MDNAFKLFILILSSLLVAERPMPNRTEKKIKSFNLKIIEEGNSVFIRSKVPQKCLNILGKQTQLQ